MSNPWPGPGQTQLDDNGDLQQTVGGGSVYIVPFGHPLDYSGLGSPEQFHFPQNRSLWLDFDACSLADYYRYSSGQTPPFVPMAPGIEVQWPTITDPVRNAGQ